MALLPGGFEEATITSSGADRVYIKNRRGFVKYALQHGYCLTPTYSFGENKCFSNLQGMWSFRLWLNSLGLPAIGKTHNTNCDVPNETTDDLLFNITLISPLWKGVGSFLASRQQPASGGWEGAAASVYCEAYRR